VKFSPLETAAQRTDHVLFLQALDAAFSHDLEQQQKSAKAGNKPNGF
jgi:hypothetical protein